MDAERCRRFLLRLFTVLVIAGAGVLATWVAVRWLLPFSAAVVTAAVLQRPLSHVLRKTGLKRGFLSFLLVLCVVLFLGAAVAILLWQGVNAAVRLLSDEEFFARIREWLAQLTAYVRAVLSRWGGEGGLAEELSERLSDTAITLLSDRLASVAADVGEWAIRQLPSLLLDLPVWMLASVFLTVDYRRILDLLRRLLPPRARRFLGAVRHHGGDVIGKLLRAYLLLMLLTFSELTVGLWALRIPHAPLLAAGIALVDILPVLGVGTVLLPWSAWLLLTGNVTSAVGMLALYVVITVIRNLVEPRIVGRQVGLPPLVTLFCMYTGLRTAGLVGLFALPLLCVVAIRLYREGILPPLRTQTAA